MAPPRPIATDRAQRLGTGRRDSCEQSTYRVLTTRASRSVLIDPSGFPGQNPAMPTKISPATGPGCTPGPRTLDPRVQSFPGADTMLPAIASESIGDRTICLAGGQYSARPSATVRFETISRAARAGSWFVRRRAMCGRRRARGITVAKRAGRSRLSQVAPSGVLAGTWGATGRAKICGLPDRALDGRASPTRCDPVRQGWPVSPGPRSLCNPVSKSLQSIIAATEPSACQTPPSSAQPLSPRQRGESLSRHVAGTAARMARRRHAWGRGGNWSEGGGSVGHVE